MPPWRQSATVTSEGLLDSNVLIAALNSEHEHHAHSEALARLDRRLTIAVHSLAETYSSLTRFPWHRPPDEAWAAVAALRQRTELRSLTAGQQYDAIRHFATRGLSGPLLHDALIGEVARAHAIGTIITWNTRHMTALFPDLRVVTPSQYLRRS